MSKLVINRSGDCGYKQNDQETPAFEGFEPANTTPVPDILFDQYLSRLREAELKALLYIIRRTWGFKKNEDAISLQQFREGITKSNGEKLDNGCGIRDKTTILKALLDLVKKGFIEQVKSFTEQGDCDVTRYRIRFKKAQEQTQEEGGGQNPPPGGQTRRRGSGQNLLGGGGQTRPTRNSNTRNSNTREGKDSNITPTCESNPTDPPLLGASHSGQEEQKVEEEKSVKHYTFPGNMRDGLGEQNWDTMSESERQKCEARAYKVRLSEIMDLVDKTAKVPVARSPKNFVKEALDEIARRNFTDAQIAFCVQDIQKRNLSLTYENINKHMATAVTRMNNGEEPGKITPFGNRQPEVRVLSMRKPVQNGFRLDESKYDDEEVVVRRA